MTNKTNEVATQENGVELVQVRTKVISETAQYQVVQDKVTGKFARKAKYDDYSSFVAENRADKIWLLNLLEGAEDTGIGLKECAGEIITVEHIITRPYDKINENTGEMEYGVLTYLINPEKQVYVTSSKSVYFSIVRMMELFGKPDSDIWENIDVAVSKKKMENGDSINIKMVG